MKRKLQFKVSSALKSVIGRDLITNDFVAIFELVKNSVDAGATKISLIFNFDEDSESTIYIVDNGKGMSYEDIQNKWLFLAYSSKSEGTEDENPRVYAGNKGVGRFSCDRLGGKLILEAKKSGIKTISRVDVDWGAFEKNAKDYFSNIDVFYSENEEFDAAKQYAPKKSGVALTITNLREEDSWDRKKLIRLRMHLAKLINPFGGEDSKVSIEIVCARESTADQKEIERTANTDRAPQLVNGLVQNSILQTLKNKTTWIESWIDDGEYLYTNLSDRGQIIYKIREKLDESLLILKDSEFKSKIFFLNRAAKVTFGRQMGVKSRDFGALFLFRNGFRVFPVGEEGDDYWGIDRRKTQGHSRYLGSREIIGKVDVSGSERHFKESSSRDKGLIETPASLALNECVTRKCLRKLERYVAGISWLDALDKDYETLERMFLDGNRSRIIQLISDLANSEDIELLDYNKELVGILNEKSEEFEPSLIKLRRMAESLGDSSLIKKIEQAESVLRRAKQSEAEAVSFAEKEQEARRNAEKAANEAQLEKERIEAAYSEERKRNSFLTSSVSRDKEQLENFIHQMIYFAGHNRRLIINQLKSIAKNQGKEWDSTRDALFQLQEGIDKIVSTSRYLTSANFRLKSGKIKGDLVKFIQEHLSVMAPMFSSGIDISCHAADKEFKMSFSPIELGMIFDNIIANSKKAKASRIHFTIKIDGKILQVDASDNGRGLSAEVDDSDRIFERGYTRTNGSGLGLHFCREQMTALGGEIKISETQPNQGFSLTLKFASNEN